jgi:uncharacterized protein
MSHAAPHNVDGENSPAAALESALAHASHLVPSQSPLDRFVHHNPLHAFESSAFDDAVLEAAKVFDSEPYWPEATYRRAFAEGRVQHVDLAWAIARAIPQGPVAGLTTRHELATALMLHPVKPLGGVALKWELTETDALHAPRPDLSVEARASLLNEAGGDPERAMSLLWSVARRTQRAPAQTPQAATGARLRDRMLVAGVDTDAVVNPALIRWSAAYLDHGVAFWPMADRGEGFFKSFLHHLTLPLDIGRPWLATARTVAATALQEDWSAAKLSETLLERMGHSPSTWDDVVLQTLLSLRGWSGMFQRLKDRPDTAPNQLRLPTELGDMLAVRLLLNHTAAAHVLGHTTDQMSHASALVAPEAAEREEHTPDPAYTLFQLAQILGIGAHSLEDVGQERIATLLEEAEAIDDLLRRQMWQAAYERHFRASRLDAIRIHAARVLRQPAVPCRAHISFCIDDREESMRRHLEEVAPWFRTLGYAGNYGISMYYRSAISGGHEALGPAGFAPKHLVVEQSTKAVQSWKASVADSTHIAVQNTPIGSLVALGGAFAAVPMIWRILNPWSHSQKTRVKRPLGPLLYKREGDAKDADGLLLGFSLEERISIVTAGLKTMGLVNEFSSLILCMGHGSTSVNNPHEAGYNCGACGGGRGAPNARVFAMMANEPEVRAALADKGIRIPDTTWFVGGYHNTSEDGIDLFDLELVPEASKGLLQEIQQALDTARALDAHERCRKFESAPLTLSPAEALAHVEGRAADLAQARPEYNHATNGMCLVGRRSWSRGLFLDRRAFLVTYDPATDPDGDVLGALLANVVPVGAGINLEYFFSTLDNMRYGCGTKLPHNITGLVGVMDGHSSDLRTGLNHQMIEIHEPVRLLCVVEATPKRLLDIATKFPAVGQLVTGGWVQLASLDPSTGELQLFEDGAFRPWEIEDPAMPTVPTSASWYRGTRGMLPCVSIFGGAE